MKTRELRQKRGEIVTRMDELLKVDTLSAEQRAEFDRLDTEQQELRGQIERLQKTEALRAELDEQVRERAADDAERRGTDPSEEKRAGQYAQAVRSYLLHGLAEMSPDLRKLLRAGEGETRAQGSASGAAGAFTIPQDFANTIEIALRYYSAVMSVAEIIPTSTGAAFPYPSVNDTGVNAAIVGENVALTDQDATFASVTFNAFAYKTIGRIPEELLQDSFFDLPRLMGDLFGDRIGRQFNAHATTGNGTSQPQGIVPAAAVGVTLGTGNTATITYDGIIALLYSVDPAYRRDRNKCGFMASDASLRTIRQLRDSQNRPIWDGGLRDGENETIMGYRVTVNNDMAAPAANARTVLFGDFTKYKVRRVRDITIRRLDERFADQLQVGVVGFARMDGKLIDAGTNPVRALVQSAT